MNNQKLQDGLNFLYRDQRVRLVHGVLKGLAIPVQRDDYADLFQEGCLVFAQVYAAFPEPVTTPAAEQKLMNYAYRKIRWRLLDILRHQQLAVAAQQYSLDQATGGPSTPSASWPTPPSLTNSGTRQASRPGATSSWPFRTVSLATRRLPGTAGSPARRSTSGKNS